MPTFHPFRARVGSGSFCRRLVSIPVMDRLKLGLGVTLLFLVAPMCQAQHVNKNGTLGVPADRSTAVSFFYFGDIWSHWREPMNFYTVGPGDPRLHRVQGPAELQSAGWVTWITEDEMRLLIKKLGALDLDWRYTARIEHFHPLRQRQIHDWVDLTVVSSRGPAQAEIRLTRMCDDLQKIDDAMPTPRILWQFRTLRWDDGCVIPGYHNEEKPKE